MGQAAASIHLVKAPEKFDLTWHKEYNSFKRYDKKVLKLEFKIGGQFHEFSITNPEFDRRFKLPVAVSSWPTWHSPSPFQIRAAATFVSA
jgi:hypothetical protein